MIFIFIIAAILFFSAVVMLLWNAILPSLLGVNHISFLESAGLLLLSKILFGGFHGGRCGGEHGPWKQKMKEKWNTMTPEERDKFKNEWKNRCGGRWGMKPPVDSAAMKQE